MMGYDRARLPVAAIRFERPVVIGRPKLALMGDPGQKANSSGCGRNGPIIHFTTLHFEGKHHVPCYDSLVFDHRDHKTLRL